MKKVHTKVDELVNAGHQPVVTKSGSVLMRNGAGKSVTLQRPSGKRTAAGKYFEGQGGSIPGGDTGYDPKIIPERIGNTEFIRMKSGKTRVTRRWDPVESDWSFTALGRSFYSSTKRNYVVQVPVIVRGQRQKGKGSYEMKSWLPISKLG